MVGHWLRASLFQNRLFGQCLALRGCLKRHFRARNFFISPPSSPTSNCPFLLDSIKIQFISLDIATGLLNVMHYKPL